MALTDVDSRRFESDRMLGLIGYGLLFSAIFFVGVPGIVAVILANIVAIFLMRMIGKNLDA